MTGISSTDSLLSSLQTTPATTRKNSKSLGQEDFLALMITQLQSQDPLKPMENGEFIGQMAQFSTVSGIADMTKSVSALTDAYSSGQALQAASMVGRTILTEDSSALMAPGKPLAGAVELPYATQAAKVRIYSDSGQLVRELPLGQGEIVVEFDLAYSKLNEKRVEKAWVDLIFEQPSMNQVILRDVTFSRRPRADL